MVGALLITASLFLGHNPFALVNGTGAPLRAIAYRATDSSAWRPLGPGALSPGARGEVPAIPGEDCAADIRAEGEGAGTLLWRDVNLCDAKVVTLNRRSDGTLWVDYD